MKKLISLTLVFVSLSAFAGILGVLQSSEPITTVTGQAAWRCTYNVGGQLTTVVLREICPPSMEFE